MCFPLRPYEVFFSHETTLIPQSHSFSFITTSVEWGASPQTLLIPHIVGSENYFSCKLCGTEIQYQALVLSHFQNDSPLLRFTAFPCSPFFFGFPSVPLTKATTPPSSPQNRPTQLGPTCSVKTAPLYWKICGRDKRGGGKGCSGGGD